MTRVLGRPLWDIRHQYGEDWSGATVALAIHEVAHATVASVLGHRVMDITISNEAGECLWSSTSASNQDRILIAAAGAGAVSYIDPSLRARGTDVWWLCDGDRDEIERLEPGIDVGRLELYRRRAASILQAHWTLFDRFAEALLKRGGALDERAVRSVLEPSAHRTLSPDDTSRVADLIATNMAQARTLNLADLARAEALVRAAVEGTEDTPVITSPRRSSSPRRGTKRTMRDVVPGLRYSDAVTVRGIQ